MNKVLADKYKKETGAESVWMYNGISCDDCYCDHYVLWMEKQLTLTSVGSSLIDINFISDVKTRLEDYELINDQRKLNKTSVDVFKGAVLKHYEMDV